MRLIDADAFDKALSDAQAKCRRSGGNFRFGVLSTVRENLANVPTIKPDAPRVMTLEEVIAHYSLPPVFVDDLGAQEDYYNDIQPLYFEFPYQEEDPWAVHWRGHAQVARYLVEWKHTYNQKWRCWTAKPTDEQREATPWQA